MVGASNTPEEIFDVADGLHEIVDSGWNMPSVSIAGS